VGAPLEAKLEPAQDSRQQRPFRRGETAARQTRDRAGVQLHKPAQETAIVAVAVVADVIAFFGGGKQSSRTRSTSLGGRNAAAADAMAVVVIFILLFFLVPDSECLLLEHGLPHCPVFAALQRIPVAS
jgi:hypothetical protein